MIKDTSYVVIPGWVISKLNLKGNAVMIYSIIYGFSQEDNGCFNGSLEYLQKWTNSTRQGVINTVKSLVNANLIIKTEAFPYNQYRVNQNVINGINCKESLHKTLSPVNLVYTDNIDNINNIDNICKDDKESLQLIDKPKKNLEENRKIEEIINYLNSICHTNFKTTSGNSRKYIKARLKEGYKVEDFKTVIEFKYNEWGLNPVRFSNGGMSSDYLRPSTLFSPKMEEYLHAAWLRESRQENQPTVKSAEKLTERSDLEF